MTEYVPREQYRILSDQKAVWESAAGTFERERDESRAERDALQRGVVAATERAEAAEAERDALAHVIEQAPHTRGCDTWNVNTDDDHCMCWKSTAPAVSLALHDAELKAQALEEAAEAVAGQRDETAGDRAPEDGLAYTSHRDGRFLGKTVAVRLLRARAAAIREEAGR